MQARTISDSPNPVYQQHIGARLAITHDILPSSEHTDHPAAMASNNPKESHSVLQHFAALPQSVLRLILIPTTSKEDKKALRQVCKSFQQVLDSSLVSITLDSTKPHGQTRFLMPLLKRMQYAPLGTVCMTAYCCVDDLLSLLPVSLTTLTLRCSSVNLKELGRLSRLTTLNLDKPYSGTTGIEHVRGLTRLQTWTPLGTVAHLAPTLKHLSTSLYSHVQDLNMLTNLEIFEVFGELPKHFFDVVSRLPLVHVCVHYADCRKFWNTSEAWKSAPTTLTRFTLVGGNSRLPDVLANSITHLQLLDTSYQNVETAGTALPGLRRLDLYMHEKSGKFHFNTLSSFTGLRSLGMCMDTGKGCILQADDLLYEYSEISEIVEKGVKLHTMKSKDAMLGALKFTYAVKPAWAIV